ncbi:MAG TPA: hypothetical protein VKA21_09160 [Candidatus Binatia bacterium]|nr:hypothetical protein [Candidatus Binatia bacterium]
MIRKPLFVLTLCLAVLAPVRARAHYTPASEFGLAVGAAAANLLYTPAKTVLAVGGLAVGAFTGLLTGGDVRAAYAIWVPAASGTFFLRPANLDGSEPIDFLGADYEDTPSIVSEPDSGGIYEAQYSR